MARPAAKTTTPAAGKPGSVMTFAHLSAVSARATAEDDKDGDPKDDDKDKTSKAEGDDPKDDKDDKDKGAKGSKAEGDDPKEDDPKEDDKDKSAKADEDSDPDADADDPDEEMKGKSAAAGARRRERARCAAIFGSEAATGRAPAAAHFAFNTTMTRSEAIAALAATPQAVQPGARAAHPGRAAGNPSVSGQGAPAPNKQQAINASWEAARKRNDEMYGRR